MCSIPPQFTSLGSPEGTVRVDPDLGDDEEAQPFDSRRGVLRPGQDGVDDVLRQVVVAGGDEDLGALDDVMIPLLLGRRLYVTHRAPGLRLGQAHRAGPLSAVHLFQVQLFLFGRSETFNQIGAAPGEAGVGGEGTARPDEHLRRCQRHGVRQPLSPGLRVHRSGHPSALAVLLEGFMERFRNFHFPLLVHAPLFVGDGIQRSDHLGGQLGPLLQDHVKRFPGEILEFVEFAEPLDPQLFVKDESNISHADWKSSVAHGVTSF